MVATFEKANVSQNVDHLEQYLIHGECTVNVNYHLLDSKSNDSKS